MSPGALLGVELREQNWAESFLCNLGFAGGRGGNPERGLRQRSLGTQTSENRANVCPRLVYQNMCLLPNRLRGNRKDKPGLPSSEVESNRENGRQGGFLAVSQQNSEACVSVWGERMANLLPLLLF